MNSTRGTRKSYSKGLNAAIGELADDALTVYFESCPMGVRITITDGTNIQAVPGPSAQGAWDNARDNAKEWL